jgi:hypothetical protein
MEYRCANFKKLKMFTAESLLNEPVLRDDQMVGLFGLEMILLNWSIG